MILGRNNDFFMSGSSAEDQMKIHVVRQESQELLDKNIFQESARRVVFWNCMAACGLDEEKVPNFNRNFYYNMP